MPWSDSILEPRPGDQGYSLRTAYRPRDTEQLARMLVTHPCRACTRVGDAKGRRWDSASDHHQFGSVLYSTIEHRCSCGLTTQIFVILNEVLREAGHDCAPAQEALDQVDDRLPPAELELGLIHTRCLLHRGDDAEAVMLAEGLLERYPDRPECHFNAGCTRQRMGHATEALAHYRRCLALHPQLADAWLNRGLLLRRLGRRDEARFCLLRVRQAGGDQAPPESSPRMLGEAPGAFDVLRVIEDEDLRALFIGEQCQGAMYRWADDGGPQPGPFAHSPFTTGWLLAGCRYPQGNGLMLGLGSGAGAVTLLTNFPQMQLTVVEVDPQLIELALRFFPRLKRLQRRGRLSIIEADARDVVSGGSPSTGYDFALLDVFTGVPEPPALLEEPGFLAGVMRSASVVLANAIFALGSEAQNAWLELFRGAGRPVVGLYPTGAPERWSVHPHNWILSTTHIEPPASFVPFSESSHFVAEAARSDFASMCSRAIILPPRAECLAPPRSHAVKTSLGEAEARLA